MRSRSRQSVPDRIIVRRTIKRRTMMRRTGPSRRRGAAGFSLIEMLVALTLLAVMLALLPGAVDMARRAWTSRPALERASALASARDVLRRQLMRAVPMPALRDDAGRRVPSFAGTRRSLTFVAPAPEGAAAGGAILMIHDLAVQPAAAPTRPGQTDLVLTLTPIGPARDGGRPVASVIMPDVTDLTIRYRAPRAAGAGDGPSAAADEEWLDAWPPAAVGDRGGSSGGAASTRTVLPRAVELTIDLASGRRETVLSALRIGQVVY